MTKITTFTATIYQIDYEYGTVEDGPYPGLEREGRKYTRNKVVFHSSNILELREKISQWFKDNPVRHYLPIDAVYTNGISLDVYPKFDVHFEFEPGK
jgi:hypothetical protein